METFISDDIGHRANKKRSDLGYGWLHYAFLRVLKPGRVLCIGSRYGYIPAILAQACKDMGRGYVDFVDAGYGQDDKNHWTGVGYWKTPKGALSFKRAGLSKYISVHVKTTKLFLKTNKKLYDYIYIDGDHSYEGVLFDYTNFWPKLKKGGIMAFHDISVTHQKAEGIYGVNKLWRKISAKNAISFPFRISGLGIIQKT